MSSVEATTRPIPSRLYGLPHAEHVYDDIAAVYESEVDPYADDHDSRSWVIEEWTVREPIDTVPRNDWILESIVENMADDTTERGWDALERAVKHPDVVAACEALRQAIAARTDYYLADEKVAEHTLTIAGGQPLVNGQPLYRSVTVSS